MTPPSRSEPLVRRAGRALVVDQGGRVLMIRGEDPADPARGGFWFPPGGGLEGDETVEHAIRRELREEIGLDVDRIGPLTMERESLFSMGGVWYRQFDSIHLVEAPGGFVPPTAQAADGSELVRVTDIRWFTPDELERMEEPVYPQRLVALLAHLVLHGPPDPPWSEISEQ